MGKQKWGEERQRIQIEQAKEEEREDMSRYRAEKPGMDGGESHVTREPIRSEKRVGRNDPCPCGSGKKERLLMIRIIRKKLGIIFAIILHCFTINISINIFRN